MMTREFTASDFVQSKVNPRWRELFDNGDVLALVFPSAYPGKWAWVVGAVPGRADARGRADSESEAVKAVVDHLNTLRGNQQ